MKGKEDFVFVDADDLGPMEEAVGNDIVDLARSGAEDSGKVGGLVSGDGGGSGGAGVGDEAATGHALSLRD